MCPTELMHLSFINLCCFDSAKMSKQINLAVSLLKLEIFVIAVLDFIASECGRLIGVYSNLYC